MPNTFTCVFEILVSKCKIIYRIKISAQAGFDVTMMDLSMEIVQKGMNAIEKSLQRMVDKGKLKGEDKSVILSRIKPTVDFKEAKEA